MYANAITNTMAEHTPFNCTTAHSPHREARARTTSLYGTGVMQFVRPSTTFSFKKSFFREF
jgi:hypothetical protein